MALGGPFRPEAIRDAPRGKDWRDGALCAQIDPDMFFPDGGAVGHLRKICFECPVLDECRRWVLSSPDDMHGVVAGMTSKERSRRRTGKSAA